MKKKRTDLKEELKKMMEQVGTYNESFDITISMCARTIEDYEKTLDQFERSGGNVVISYTNKNGSKNPIKNPLYQAIEYMRKDILAYLRDLGLTPSGLKKINQDSFSGEVKDSPLVEVLKRLM